MRSRNLASFSRRSFFDLRIESARREPFVHDRLAPDHRTIYKVLHLVAKKARGTQGTLTRSHLRNPFPHGIPANASA